jgi:hypothetical protein
MSTNEIPPLPIGARVRFGYPGSEARRWWTVRAVDGRFTVLTRQRDFRPKGESFYTIIDRVRGVRGPCNLIGQGWDVDEPGGPQALLRALNYHLEVSARLAAGEGRVVLDEASVKVSHRNNVPVEVLEVRD